MKQVKLEALMEKVQNHRIPLTYNSSQIRISSVIFIMIEAGIDSSRFQAHLLC